MQPLLAELSDSMKAYSFTVTAIKKLHLGLNGPEPGRLSSRQPPLRQDRLGIRQNWIELIDRQQ
jgi:hypothetical protein